MVFRMLHHCQRTACYKISLCDHKNFSFYISQCLHYTEQSVNAIKKVAFENICCLFSHTNTPPPSVEKEKKKYFMIIGVYNN